MVSTGWLLFSILAVAFAALVVVALCAVVRQRLDRGAPPWDEWLDDGPEEEKALVPIGPPRKPRPSSAVALPLPEPDPEATDAYRPDALAS